MFGILEEEIFYFIDRHLYCYVFQKILSTGSSGVDHRLKSGGAFDDSFSYSSILQILKYVSSAVTWDFFSVSGGGFGVAWISDLSGISSGSGRGSGDTPASRGRQSDPSRKYFVEK